MTVEPLTDDDVAAWLPRHLRDPDGLLTSPEVCRMAGVTYRQLDYWIRSGWVASHTEALGSGHHRRFDLDDLRDIRVVARLANARNLSGVGSALETWRGLGRPADALIGLCNGRPAVWLDVDLLRTTLEERASVVVTMAEPPLTKDDL